MPTVGRALLPALAMLALVGLVAIASRGSTSSGTNTGRAPADWVFDTVLTLGLLAVVVAAGIYVYALLQRKEVPADAALMRRFRRLSWIGFAIFMLLLTLAAYFRLRDWKQPEFVEEIGEQGFTNEPPQGASDSGTVYEPEFAWIPVIVVIALAALAVVAWFIADRRSKRAFREDEDDTIAEALASALDDSLDDLRAESDPRRAVIAAYARLERVLGAHGLPRHESETPDELLTRILPGLDVERASIRRLTALFTWAKFSQHEVDHEMKDRAISALAQVRDELRARDAAAVARVTSLRLDPDGRRA